MMMIFSAGWENAEKAKLVSNVARINFINDH
jgi:hypothetical protein